MAELLEQNIFSDKNGGYEYILDDGTTVLLRKEIPYIPSGKEDIYTVKHGDYLWRTVWEKYRTLVSNPETYVTFIAKVNNIRVIDDISDRVGQQLLFPNPVSVFF